jgi:hypothetical protein
MRRYYPIPLDDADRRAVGAWFRWSLIAYTSAALTLALLVAGGGARQDSVQSSEPMASSMETVAAGTNVEMPVPAVTAVAAPSRQNAPAESHPRADRSVDTGSVVSDPVINGFVGLSENAWDFNVPDSIPGFGSLPQAEGPVATARLPDKAAPSAASE